MILVSFILALAQQQGPKTAQPAQLPVPAIVRPRDPFVFRCVLDKRVRIVTLALSDELWAAWDTQTLPHTPPTPGKRSNAAFEALGEIKKQPLLTLFLLTIPVSCIHQFYFVHTESFLGAKQAQAPEFMKAIFGAGGGGLMTIGQMSEVIVLGAITLFAKRVSRKTLLAVGLLAYAARMALFAYVDMIPLPQMVTLVVGLALHGPIFGCFIFLAFMIVDEETTGDVRASAQSLYNLVIVGIGVIVGSLVAGWVANWATLPAATPEDAAVTDYTRLFSVPMWASLACLSLLLTFYPYNKPALATGPSLR